MREGHGRAASEKKRWFGTSSVKIKVRWHGDRKFREEAKTTEEMLDKVVAKDSMSRRSAGVRR